MKVTKAAKVRVVGVVQGVGFRPSPGIRRINWGCAAG